MIVAQCSMHTIMSTLCRSSFEGALVGDVIMKIGIEIIFFCTIIIVCIILARLILPLRYDIYLHHNIIISKTNDRMGLKFHPARGIIREKAF